MSQSTNTLTQVSRRAILFSASGLLLVVMALSLLIVTHTTHAGAPRVASSNNAASSSADSTARLPGRLSFTAEHSVCAAQLATLSQVANAEAANAPVRLPGQVYYRLIFQSTSCA